ncbi:MAG: FMN-binding protein, partial [Spirochaetales bacterium]|nr:FMN-binding protein [Spirochaetales bacterium]
MKTRKVLLVVLAAICLLATACVSIAQRFQPGTYEGIGQGHGGEIKVAVTVSEEKIIDIKVLGMQETAYMGDAAIETLT